MRSILAFAAVLMLVTSPAFAAPTCQDRNGGTIKCGTPGAMPVGWTLPLEQRLEQQMLRPPYSNETELLELFCIMGVFFALLALVPEFDGRRARDWDEQEDDRDDRR